MKIMYCNKCGAELKKGDAFCPSCGAKNIAAKESAKKETKVAAKKASVKTEAKAETKKAETTETPNKETVMSSVSKEKSSGNGWVYAAIGGSLFVIFLFIVALGGISLYAYSKVSDKVQEGLDFTETDYNYDDEDFWDDWEWDDEDYSYDDEYYEDYGILYEMDPYLQPVGTYAGFGDMDDLTDQEIYESTTYLTEADLVQTDAGHDRFADQYNTLSAVVKVVCEDTDYYYYGSGTNLSEYGYIVTNQHVVMEDGYGPVSCIVGFSDPESGLVREAYSATIIEDAENETGHDLAILSIEGPVYDDEGNVYGFYEKYLNGTFPYFEETDECLETPPRLGDETYILGYPTLSGGALTITNGLISSLYSADGYLITSAKISSGNSGGLAVDSNSCFVGVPTAVYLEEESEQYGEIIDASFVYDFLDAVDNDIDAYLGE